MAEEPADGTAAELGTPNEQAGPEWPRMLALLRLIESSPEKVVC